MVGEEIKKKKKKKKKKTKNLRKITSQIQKRK